MISIKNIFFILQFLFLIIIIIIAILVYNH